MIDPNELRRRVREQVSFADSVEAFFHLLKQPDLRWRDLLDGLDYPGLIASNAVVRLHRLLNTSVPSSGFIADRNAWAKILKEMGILEDDIVTAKPKP